MGADLLVEQSDDDPDRRVQLGRSERRIEVGQVIVAGQDDDAGAGDLGLAQDARLAGVADDEVHAHRRERFGGVLGRADRDDLLIAGPQLVDRAEAEVRRAAHHHVAATAGARCGRIGLRHPGSLSGGRRPIEERRQDRGDDIRFAPVGAIRG